MPIIITFDQKHADSNDLNRIHSMFLRFGWQNLGGSTYRYPAIGAKPQTEDWLNHVVPALMLFRTYFTSTKHPLLRFTLEAHSSCAFDSTTGLGSPSNGPEILFTSWKPEFGESNLLTWLHEIKFPYQATKRP
jgi:hypothetical protein